MFTIEQIKAAHSKVRSGADFPAYIKDLKELGVSRYKTHVSDGRTDFFDNSHFQVSSQAVYKELHIAGECHPAQFSADLKAHQEGKTDYLTFCNACAGSGIAYWIVDVEKMSCTYFDKEGNEILVEEIPG